MESVWDYPRPPRVEETGKKIRVVQSGEMLAQTRAALRVLETSHPPVYYLPAGDVRMERLSKSAGRGSFCEFKGVAVYWDLVGGARQVAWSYEAPSKGYERLRGCLAFYAGRVDECWVEEERVLAQQGDFYGGWITKDVTGPFKGAAGTLGW